ncbi:glycosyltransferase family 2 protein [Psychromonas sp. SR45-3]|uniref:glycosyltransferase family 2 protein n=1 Tax=Psychromonas sp. SR45-3 TaxID=2760930 RepID=UPI0015FB66DF|nr:glycosyltransferase family 2 protein [Psychromonas sp. SR45-3]MBB1272813.1 glycosyltransferase family 2 protein [Psychromonas sp. SR45-3]
MAHIYISIVSHGNDDDIINNSNLKEINILDNVTVIIRDNLSSPKLKTYCAANYFMYNASDAVLGFGANNNINFEVASNLGMNKTDWFVLFNPDLDISAAMINKLSASLGNYSSQIFAINLFFDDKFSKMENSLRKFPTFCSFFNVLKGSSFTKAYDKKKLSYGGAVDWAAASFLAFKSDLYKQLNGFDENYFMYYEDVDICYRANKYFNQKVIYLPDIKAVHQGAYRNRNVFSKHFRWYLKSLLRFLFKSTFGMKK